MSRIGAIAAGVALALAAGSTPPVAGATPTLRQLPGAAGCLGAKLRGCASDPLMAGFSAFALSPDGRHAYVVAGGEDGPAVLLAFARNLRTGALSRIQCVAGGTTAGCLAWPSATRAATDVAVSSDGTQVLVLTENGLHVLARDGATGTLAPTGCFTSDGGPCGPQAQALNASSLAVSPGAETVALIGIDETAVLRRDGGGAFKPVPGLALPEGTLFAAYVPGGRFVVANVGTRVLVLDAATLAVVDCVSGKQLRHCRRMRLVGDRSHSPEEIAVGPAGQVYLNGGSSGPANRVVSLQLDLVSGRIRGASCLANPESHSRVCRPTERFAADTWFLTTIPRRRGVVAVAETRLAVLGLDGRGRLAPSSRRSCMRLPVDESSGAEAVPRTSRRCPRVRGLEIMQGAAASADGRSVYVWSDEALALLAVR